MGRKPPTKERKISPEAPFPPAQHPSPQHPSPAAQFPQLSCHHLHRHLVLEAEVKFLRVLQLEFPESPPKCPAQIGVRHMVLQSVFDGNVDGHTVLGVYELKSTIEMLMAHDR